MGDGGVDSPPISIIAGKGPTQKTFYAHRECLVNSSEYFQTALNSNFAEAQNHIVRLEEDDPEAVWLFTMWQYGSIGETLDPENAKKDASIPSQMDDILLQHVNAFVLGNKLVAAGFKNELLRSLHEYLVTRSRSLFSMQTLVAAARNAYEGTSTEDGWQIRKFLAMYCATRLGYDQEVRNHHNQPRAEHPWTQEERRELTTSGVDEFVADVLGEALCKRLPNRSELTVLMYLPK